MIEPARGSEPPLPHLTGRRGHTETFRKKSSAGVALWVAPAVLLCLAVYGFYEAGVLFRTGLKSPLFVLVPASVYIFVQVMLASRRRSEAREDD